MEGSYAHALFSAASKSNNLEKVEQELTTISGFMASDQAFANFLSTPVLSRADKTQAVEKALTAKKMSATTVNFFGAMAENNRLAETAGVIKAFGTLMSAHRREVECTVTSAAPLSKAELASITKSLSGFTEKGETVKVTTLVDESILGGLKVEVGDKFVDMSTRTKINKVVATLSEPI